MARRAVVLVGGWMHPPDAPVAALTPLLTERGFAVDVVTDPGSVAAALDGGCELLVVAACWFSMADSRYTPEQRAEWSVGPDPERERALLAVADTGTPVLALHTAVICFDGWTPWADWLGGAWNWHTSFHPPPAPIEVTAEAGSPIDFEPFTVVDEEYQGLDLDPAATVVARSGAGHPLAWLNVSDGRRAAVAVGGHDRRSLDHPSHRHLLAQLCEITEI